MPVTDSVAIIGGGFSGTLQAINLVRHQGPRALLIERRPEAGRGVAYSAAHPSHLLNVRAANMSALPDEPDHFVKWLAQRGHSDTGEFAPRSVYGEYLAELLEEARQAHPDRLQIVRGEAVDLQASDGVEVFLQDSSRLRAGAAVLALGNLLPAPPDNLDPGALSAGCYAPDPWVPGLAEGLGPHDEVLIVGTGLTTVDVALLLDARGFRGRITAISRRGLLPRRQAAGPPVSTRLLERPNVEVSALLHGVRERSRKVGWHAAVDELRPFTQSIWLGATDDQRRRFLRHLRAWWDVHRHRIAPPVATQLETLWGEGRLRVLAGRTLDFEPLGERVRVTWLPRSMTSPSHLTARRIINCTGPRSDLQGTNDPFLRRLAANGLIAPDPLGLGIAVDRQARVLGADGIANPQVFALGPMTRGTFWEITAVPDIRVQTWTLARYLSNAHWVAGEGL